MPNWEAVAIIGGGAVVLVVILSATVIGIRRYRRKGRVPAGGSMPRAGIVLYGTMTLALLSGFVVLPSTRLARYGAFSLVVYSVLVVALFTLIAGALERRGIKVSPKPVEDTPPGTALERTVEDEV